MNLGISSKRILKEMLIVLAIISMLFVFSSPRMSVSAGVGVDGVYSHLDGSYPQIPLWRR